MVKGNRSPAWLSGCVTWVPSVGGWIVVVRDGSVGRQGDVRATDLFESRKFSAQLASVGVLMEHVDVVSLLCILCPTCRATGALEEQTRRLMDLLNSHYATYAGRPIVWRQQ